MVTFHDLADVSDEQTLDWLEAIAANLRPGDLDEMQATNPLPFIGPPDPLTILVISAQQSHFVWVICDDGVPICVFGCGGDDRAEGCIWMLGTPGMERRGAAFAIARATPRYVAFLHLIWRRLANHVDARNHTSIRWLLSNGFEIESVDFTHGRERRPFFLFSSTREGPSNL